MHQITTWYPVFAIAAGSLIVGSITMYFGNYGVLRLVYWYSSP